MGCHFLLQCMKGKSESEVAQSCLTLQDPMDCSLPGSSVRGIFQARVLEWGAIAFSDALASDWQIASSTWGLQSLLGFFRLAPWSEPYSKWKTASSKGTPLGAMRSLICPSLLLWVLPKLVLLLWSLCLHGSRSRVVGCLLTLFLSTPAARKSARMYILVSRMGPSPAPAPFGVFTLLFPVPLPSLCFSQASHRRGHPTQGTRIVVRDPKEVDGVLFKMASQMLQ